MSQTTNRAHECAHHVVDELLDDAVRDVVSTRSTIRRLEKDAQTRAHQAASPTKSKQKKGSKKKGKKKKVAKQPKPVDVSEETVSAFFADACRQLTRDNGALTERDELRDAVLQQLRMRRSKGAHEAVHTMLADVVVSGRAEYLRSHPSPQTAEARATMAKHVSAWCSDWLRVSETGQEGALWAIESPRWVKAWGKNPHEDVALEALVDWLMDDLCDDTARFFDRT